MFMRAKDTHRVTVSAGLCVTEGDMFVRHNGKAKTVMRVVRVHSETEVDMMPVGFVEQVWLTVSELAHHISRWMRRRFYDAVDALFSRVRP